MSAPDETAALREALTYVKGQFAAPCGVRGCTSPLCIVADAAERSIALAAELRLALETGVRISDEADRGVAKIKELMIDNARLIRKLAEAERTT